MSKEHPSVEQMLHDFASAWQIFVECNMDQNRGSEPPIVTVAVSAVHVDGVEIYHTAPTFTEALARVWTTGLTDEFDPEPSIGRGGKFVNVIAGISHWRIRVESDESTVETTWGEFCNDNSEDLGMLWEARREMEGCGDGTYQGGGGAAPVFKLTRVGGEKSDTIAWFSPECSHHSATNKPRNPFEEFEATASKSTSKPTFDPTKTANDVLQEFEEAGGPEGDEYITVMRAISEEAAKRAQIFEARRARGYAINGLTKMADALWKLRGEFNYGKADPADKSATLAARLLESFASYVSCLASDGHYNEDTAANLHNNIMGNLDYTPPHTIVKKG